MLLIEAGGDETEISDVPGNYYYHRFNANNAFELKLYNEIFMFTFYIQCFFPLQKQNTSFFHFSVGWLFTTE